MKLVEPTNLIAEDVRILREALAARPAPGPWEFYPGGTHARGSIASAEGHLCTLSTRRGSPYGAERTVEQMRVDGAYITACFPDRIERLLDALAGFPDSSPQMITETEKP